MDTIASDAAAREVIVGVDTHKHIHVAVAIDRNGVRLGEHSVSVDRGGYAQLEAWAQALGRVGCFGVEGTGSYGAGLAGYLRRCGHRVVEVNRGDRSARRNNGKCDPGDAETAARSVLSGTATAVPKAADGLAEMIRQVKIARDTARKANTAAIVALKAMVINAPAELRESLDALSDKALIKRCAAFRVRGIDTTTASAKHSLRALARRWLFLDAEIVSHDRELDRLTVEASPTLRDGLRHRSRLRSRAAHRVRRQPPTDPLRGGVRETLRDLPDPGLLRTDQPAPPLPRRPPPSQRCALPDRDRAHAIPPAHHRLRRPPHHRGPHQKRHHPLPQTLRRPRGLRTRHGRPPSPNPAARTNNLTYRGINALAETVIGLYQSELIRGPCQGPWDSAADVELATLGWVHWHNHQRIHTYLGDVPPAEFEAAYAARQPDQQTVGNQ